MLGYRTNPDVHTLTECVLIDLDSNTKKNSINVSFILSLCLPK